MTANGQSNVAVLIVDDFTLNRECLAARLAQHGQ